MAQSDRKNTRQIVRPRECGIVAAEGEKSHGRAVSLKDVKNEGRSGNVYENKGPRDKMSDTKDDISAWLQDILHKNTGVFWQPSLLL